MTTEEKINLLNEYNNIPILLGEHFTVLEKFSFDKDSLVKSMVASLLINYTDEASKNILLRLAKDEDSLVRTEACDSLVAFPCHDVQVFLRELINVEANSLTRSYIILSWADVSLALSGFSEDRIIEITQMKALEKSKKCLLSYCYALYVNRCNNILTEIFSYLEDEDYQIRCSTISLLEEIVSETNKQAIRDSVSRLLTVEDTVAVKSRAERFLKDI